MLSIRGSGAICALFITTVLHAQTSPFVGRWDFNLTEADGKPAASWLGVSAKGSDLAIMYQPTGGHVIPITDYKGNGSHMNLNLGPNLTWSLDAKGGKLVGTQTRKGKTIELTGVKAPELKRSEPKAWSTAKNPFNGKNLNGWTPIGDVANSHWVVKDGYLLNEAHGANLKSDEKFTDFKAHFEVNCPEPANSGFYLRGRYELQMEYETQVQEPPERSMGAIYGRIPPAVALPRMPGQWESFDVMLVGRTVTVHRNGKLTIDHKEIEGITGGALDANEGEPGPFYIQGDHTGGLKFRNITVSVPKQ